ncbi:hypothetical protein Ancab_029259 [Ancistrocladus abbreviatus]
MDYAMDIERLLDARHYLRDSLEKSRLLSSAIEGTGSRLGNINQKLPSLVTEVCSSHAQMCMLAAVKRHVERVIGPAVAVIKAHDAVRGLERLSLSDACWDTFSYLLVVKQMAEAMRFLNDNCGLAVQWMEDVVKLLDNDADATDEFVLNVLRSLRLLKELKAMDARARLRGGLLSAAFDKLELGFRQLLIENLGPIRVTPLSTLVGEQPLGVPSPLPEEAIQKFHAILEWLKANDRLENCMTIYADVRGSTVRAALQALNTSYVEMQVSEGDSVQTIEDYITQWGKHIQYAVKHVFEIEHELSKKVFEKIGWDVSAKCFGKITAQSEFLSLLQFGYKVTDTKKDAIKLLKLLDVFRVLEELRLDFNRLFGGKDCLEIQTVTRNLIKKVINGAWEIFKELPAQVELQRHTPPPPDGSVPRLVTFVTNYCIMLLEDDYGPILSQVASIHQIWNQERSCNGGDLRYVLYKIVRAMEINLEKWSKTYEDNALTYFFLMNNYLYLQETIRGTQFADLMGDNWLRKCDQHMEYYVAAYLKESWGKLPNVLSEDGLILFSPGRTTARELVKQRLKEFNDSFEAMYKRQSDWVVNDKCTGEKTCQLVVKTVIPAYRSYLHNYAFLVEKGSSPSKYLKYTALGMEGLINCLFQPKVEKVTPNKPTNRLIGRIRSIVASQFRPTPVTI